MSLLLLILLIVGFLILLFILWNKNKALQNRLKENHLLVHLLENEKISHKRISKLLHDQLQSDLVAIKYLIFIYRQQQDSNEKQQTISNMELALEKSIENAKRLSEKLTPPFLNNGDFEKAITYYFDGLNKVTNKQFLFENRAPSTILFDKKEYQLFRIVEMFCDYVIDEESATAFTLLFNESGIELKDNGNPFIIDSEKEFSNELFLSLPARLKILDAELKQQHNPTRNHFFLQLKNIL